MCVCVQRPLRLLTVFLSVLLEKGYTDEQPCSKTPGCHVHDAEPHQGKVFLLDIGTQSVMFKILQPQDENNRSHLKVFHGDFILLKFDSRGLQHGQG